MSEFWIYLLYQIHATSLTISAFGPTPLCADVLYVWSLMCFAFTSSVPQCLPLSPKMLHPPSTPFLLHSLSLGKSFRGREGRRGWLMLTAGQRGRDEDVARCSQETQFICERGCVEVTHLVHSTRRFFELFQEVLVKIRA